MDDFAFFTKEDRQDSIYKACVFGTTIAGLSVGGFGGNVVTVVGGAAAGLAYGLVSCRRLSPAIEKKLFSSTERFAEGELLSVLRVIHDLTGVQKKSEALFLLIHARQAAVATGQTIRSGQKAFVAPRTAANQILARTA